MDTSKLELLKALGFDDEVENLKSGRCPFCGSTKTSKEDFRDEMSYREFKISGLCQGCQDRSFVDPEDE
jgi:hypothetical protein